jgi:hypothetical protein
MVVEQKVKAVKKIRIIKDPNFSVTTHDGLTITCSPSGGEHKLYCLFSTVKLRAYFGIATGPLATREKNRREEIKAGFRAVIHNAILEQGLEAFVMFEVKSFGSRAEVAEAEKLYIRNFKSHKTMGGYNSTWGGEMGGWNTEELEKAGWKRIHKIIDFKKSHNRWPSGTCPKIEGEKSLGSLLNQLRRSHNKPEGCTNKFYKSYQKLAEELGEPEMFFSPEKLYWKTIREIIEFKKSHNRWPSKTCPKIEGEKLLGEVLVTLRSARNDIKCKGDFFPSYQKIAEELGEPEMFASEKEIKNLKLEKFALFINEKGRLPKHDIKEEKTLYRWMSKTKADIKSGSLRRWSQSNNETAIRLAVLKFLKD